MTGGFERRQNAEIEDRREGRQHEQELQRQKAENDNRIVDQVLKQQGEQTSILTQQNDKLSTNLFAQSTEQITQVVSGQTATQTAIADIARVAATQAVTAEQSQQTARSLQIEMGNLNRNIGALLAKSGVSAPVAAPAQEAAPAFKPRAPTTPKKAAE